MSSMRYRPRVPVNYGAVEIVILGDLFIMLFCEMFSLCIKDYDIHLYTLSHCMCGI
jgi:hypothetical protein